MNNSSATPSGNNILDAAHLAASRGWRVIPLHRVGGGKWCSCEKGGRCESKGKHPKHKTWQNTPPMSAADIQATWDVKLPPNLGIATGDPSGFWVLDIDPGSGGMESAQRLAAEHGPLPATRIVKTGSGGYHYHFAMPADFPVTNRNAWFRQNGYPGIDVRGTGGQIVAPPSATDKGEYLIVHDVETFPQAPAWLLEAIRPPAEVKPVVTAQDVDLDLAALYANDRPEFERLANYARTVRDREVARLGECVAKGWDGPPWNITTFEVACTLIQLGNSPWTTYNVDHAYADVFSNAPRDAGFGDAEVNKCFTSAQSRIGDRAREAPPKPDDGPVYRGDPLTDPTASAAGKDAGSKTPAAAPHVKMRPWDDLGNGQRMVDHYGHTLRWIEQAGTWAVYDKGRWLMDEMRLGQHLVQKMIDGLIDTEAELYSEELEGDDDKASPREKFVKWAKAQRSASKVAACLKTTQGILSMQARVTDFDQHDMLLNVANGVVDLATGQLLPHNPDLMLMQQSPVSYDPEAKAPMWQRFLDQVLPDPEIQRYLQQICGYSLSGKTGEQGMFLHHGTGANGKSVFLVVAGHVAGDYGQVVPRETLLVQSGNEHPTSVARMVGKRFLQVSETAAGRRLDEEVIKNLTGGEKATARYMAQNFFDFKPTGKIHYVTNHLPRLTNADSIWRRLHLIGWRVTIPEELRDAELAQKIIAAEAAGVLAWMVRGATEWAAAGRLHRPDATVRDLRDYRDDQDEFGDFMRECLHRAYTPAGEPNPAVREPLGVIYGAYTAWCYRTGIRSPMRQADLGRALRERGIPEYRTSASRGFEGLRVVVSTNVVLGENVVVPDSPAGLDPLGSA